MRKWGINFAVRAAHFARLDTNVNKTQVPYCTSQSGSMQRIYESPERAGRNAYWLCTSLPLHSSHAGMTMIIQSQFHPVLYMPSGIRGVQSTPSLVISSRSILVLYFHPQGLSRGLVSDNSVLFLFSSFTHALCAIHGSILNLVTGRIFDEQSKLRSPSLRTRWLGIVGSEIL